MINPAGERVQIARSSAAMSDQVNLAFTFTDNGLGNPSSCNADNEAINGIEVLLFQGTCAALPALGLEATLDPLVAHIG